MEQQRKSGIQSKIAETVQMVHRLNIQLKNIETEARHVDAVKNSLERNANGKLGLSGVTAHCLEIKRRKVRVRGEGGVIDIDISGQISAEQASREDGVLALLHDEASRQGDTRELLGAHLEQAKRTAHVLSLYKQEVASVLRDKQAALRIERECLMLGVMCDAEVIGWDAGTPNDAKLLNAAKRGSGPRSLGMEAMRRDLEAPRSHSGMLALSPTKGALPRPVSAMPRRTQSSASPSPLSPMPRPATAGGNGGLRGSASVPVGGAGGASGYGSAAGALVARPTPEVPMPVPLPLSVHEAATLEELRQRLANGFSLSAEQLSAFKQLAATAAYRQVQARLPMGRVGRERGGGGSPARTPPRGGGGRRPGSAAAAMGGAGGDDEGSDDDDDEAGGGSAAEAKADWRDATNRLLNEAFTAYSRCRQWRESVRGEVDSTEGRQRTLFSHTTRALKQMVAQGEARVAALHSKQIHLDTELRRLHGTRRRLEAAMRDKSVPLAGARRTMLLRAERPARERQTADEVDEMMERQYGELKAVVGAIDAEQNTTADDIERLTQLAAELRADFAWSAEVLARDKECLRRRQDFSSHDEKKERR